jgi:cytosol alanyl aminopeptidase
LPRIPGVRTIHVVLIGLALAGCEAASSSPARAPSTGNAGVAPTLAHLPAEAPPLLELPADVRAVREQLELHVDPTSPTFRGTAELELALGATRDVVWLHGRGLHVTRVEAAAAGAKIAGRWEEVDPSGVAKVSFASPLAAGAVVLHVEWDAPYVKGTKGLYVTEQSGRSYAATQFEAIDARRAFPCMDQPSAKIPYEVALVVKQGDEAFSNGREISREPEGSGHVRVRFAATPPIPSYLVAFAVGPYDVVKGADVPASAVRTAPIPLRGVAAKGRGPELAYAMANAGAIVTKLEEYFGVAYPYEKLDLLAIPDRAGAMENAGAVMFSEDGLLVDPKNASDGQLRLFGVVVTHELAHQWFGDLVTMKWWNDLWLNEAFATWTAGKIGDVWDPKVRSALGLLEGVQGAMGADALASARAIRQPIVTNDDIENGFDGITYQKGAGVIRMFERWVGEEAFRRGVRAHLEAHRFGNATSDEFLAAVSAAAGKDVGTALHTFLDRPGVPFVEVAALCDGAPRLHVKQSRYLPLGSTADANVTWKVPFCARYGVKGAAPKETCVLVEAAESDVPLAACPEWVMPNARAGGYYRFSLAPTDLAKLQKAGLKELDVSERIAFGNGLRAAYRRGALPYGDIVEAASALATDPHSEVANEPIGFLSSAHDWLLGDPARPKAEAYAARLFGPVARDLGYAPKKDEDVGRGALRRDVLYFLVDHAKDAAVRAELTKRGRAYFAPDGSLHPDAVAPNLATLALRVWAEGGDEATFDALRAALGKTEDSVARGRLTIAAASIRAPAAAEKGRRLSLDPVLRTSEMLTPLWTQFGYVESRDAAWTWLQENYDALFARLKDVPFGALQLVLMTRSFCDETRAADVKAFFLPRVAAFDGGPRELAAAVEDIKLCARVRAVHQPQAKAFFERK